MVLARLECKMTREQWKNRKQKQPSHHYNVRNERLIYEVNKAFDWCEKKLSEMETK